MSIRKKLAMDCRQIEKQKEDFLIEQNDKEIKKERTDKTTNKKINRHK